MFVALANFVFVSLGQQFHLLNKTSRLRRASTVTHGRHACTDFVSHHRASDKTMKSQIFVTKMTTVTDSITCLDYSVECCFVVVTSATR